MDCLIVRHNEFLCDPCRILWYERVLIPLKVIPSVGLCQDVYNHSCMDDREIKEVPLKTSWKWEYHWLGSPRMRIKSSAPVCSCVLGSVSRSHYSTLLGTGFMSVSSMHRCTIMVYQLLCVRGYCGGPSA